MVGSAQFVSPKPTLLPPVAPPATPGSGTAPHGGPSFMQIMNEQPAMVTPPHNEPVPGAPDDAPAAKAAPAAPRRKESPAQPAKAPNTAQPAARGAAPTALDATQPKAATDETSAAQDPADQAQDDPTRTASLTELTQLIGLTPSTPASVAALPTPPDVDTASLPADSATAAVAAGGKPGAGTRAARGLADSDEGATAAGARPTDPPDEKSATVDRRLTDTAARGAEASRARVADAAADKAALVTRGSSNDATPTVSARAPEAAAPRSLGGIEGGAPNFAAVLAQSLPTGISAPDASPAPASGRVHAGVHSPGFAPELAANVSLLAADGVQHAELQLNPADMGPVAVQIIVDGAQAQVSFHAVQADTRQALERSLPDLAAALQGQGLTLSGGGVFQQARRDAQPGDAEAGNGDERGSRASGAAGGRISGAAGTAQVAIRRAAGLLDTFA